MEAAAKSFLLQCVIGETKNDEEETQGLGSLDTPTFEVQPGKDSS
jgi:hypothetical protein